MYFISILASYIHTLKADTVVFLHFFPPKFIRYVHSVTSVIHISPNIILVNS